MRNEFFLKLRVSEIHVNQIRVNQGLGVVLWGLSPPYLVHGQFSVLRPFLKVSLAEQA